MSDEEIDFCPLCGRSPCVWEEDGPRITETFDSRYGAIPVEGSIAEMKQEQKQRRYYMYTWYVRDMYGVLGRTIRVRLPECITLGIRRLAPDPDSQYLGFRDTEQ